MGSGQRQPMSHLSGMGTGTLSDSLVLEYTNDDDLKKSNYFVYVFQRRQKISILPER